MIHTLKILFYSKFILFHQSCSSITKFRQKDLCVQYKIFLLLLSSSLTSDSQEDIKNKLAEATRTAYIRGRWVFTDSWGETQHSIVAPTLPDSGDYSPYIHWGIDLLFYI